MPFLLTARAVLVLACVIYLFVGPVRAETDIVSAVVASTALALVSASFVGVVASGAMLRRRLQVTLYPPVTDRDEFLGAGEPQIFAIKTSATRILPFLALDITVTFDRPGGELPTIRLSGSAKAERTVTASARFPHRGVWRVERIRFDLGDRAGLVRYSWFETRDVVIKVAPPLQPESTLPVLSSSNRPGDTVTDLHNRHGELYDLKPYHPSDGIKKIVWKVFARRGELLSRHPEPSMTPEGQVLIYTLAKPAHDRTAGEAIAYCRLLDELRLTLYTGCEGMGNREPATTPDGAADLLVDCAWDSAESTYLSVRSEVLRLLAAPSLTTRDISISRVVFFVSADRFATRTDVEDIVSLAGSLSDRGIEPVFCMNSGSTGTTNYLAQEPKAMLKKHLGRKLKNVLVRPGSYLSADTFAANFLCACLERNWQVYL